jgi:hypothetical protein
VRGDHLEALDALVERALRHNEEGRENMTTDGLDDYRDREQYLREQEAKAIRELKELQAKVDQVQEDDIEAFANAAVHKQAIPSATADKVQARLKRLELRDLPGWDAALWKLAGEVRNALEPDADSEDARSLLQATPRWVGAPRRRDPANVLPVPHGTPRPANIVGWVVGQRALIKEHKARMAAEVLAKERYQEAYLLISQAESEHMRRENEEIGQRIAANPGLGVMEGTRPKVMPRPFNREAWMKGRTISDGTPIADAYQLVDPSAKFTGRGRHPLRGEQRGDAVVPA